jgi:hypothetical protein
MERAEQAGRADDVERVGRVNATEDVEDTAEDREDRSVTPDPALADLSPSTEAAVIAPESVYADPAAGVGPASAGETGAWRDIRPGMEVVGSDGESVGLVKEVRTADFLLDRVMRRDLYVPYSAVERVLTDVVPERVVLTIRGADVAVVDWESPPLT